ncbi:MAG: replicative DNA helicase [Saccharofermentans sp.]|nr:replicative DNA helicase [Saccharofermentans sp.]
MSDRDLQDNLIDEIPQQPSQAASYNALEAEKAVLSLCMRNKEALDSSVVKAVAPGDFTDPKHELIFKAISSIYMDNRRVDRVGVCEWLRTEGLIDKAGGDKYVYDVANYSDSVMSLLDTYVSAVTANAQSRKLLATLNELTAEAKKRKTSVNDIVDLGVARLNLLKTKDDTSGFEPLADILKRNINNLKEAAHGGGDRNVVKTGFSYLDNITGGFKPGSINVIAARPGMGKTALILNIATNVAGIYGKKVAIFSLEMSKSEIANRILAAQSKTNFKKIQRANISPEDEADLEETLGRISPMPIYIDEKTDTNPLDIMSKCKELIAEGPLSLVIIDYLQLLTYPGKESGSRQNEIAAISRALKVLAKDLQVPVIALSQLNRGTENGDDDDHIPTLANIRDSGAIEQDADCVIFIHRPDYYNKKKDSTNKPMFEDAQLIVAKNRHGETDTAYVKWYGAKTLFIEPDRKGDPQDPQGGQGSSYTRTTTSDRAAGDYHFEPEPEPESYEPEPVPEEDDGFMDNSENDEFFGEGEVHDDLPGDY